MSKIQLTVSCDNCGKPITTENKTEREAEKNLLKGFPSTECKTCLGEISCDKCKKKT